MHKTVQEILEPLNQQCLALAGTMLAAAIEEMKLCYQADTQRHLEGVAGAYEQEGLTELANTLRERMKELLQAKTAPVGKASPETKAGSRAKKVSMNGEEPALAQPASDTLFPAEPTG
jgi:uncharacterized protein (UPF0179 family)